MKYNFDKSNMTLTQHKLLIVLINMHFQPFFCLPHAMARAWRLAIVTAWRAVSNPAWRGIFQRNIIFLPSECWNIVSMLCPCFAFTCFTWRKRVQVCRTWVVM